MMKPLRVSSSPEVRYGFGGGGAAGGILEPSPCPVDPATRYQQQPEGAGAETGINGLFRSDSVLTAWRNLAKHVSPRGNQHQPNSMEQREDAEEDDFEQAIKRFRLQDFEHSQNREVQILRSCFNLQKAASRKLPQQQMAITPARVEGMTNNTPLSVGPMVKRQPVLGANPTIKPFLDDASSCDEDTASSLSFMFDSETDSSENSPVLKRASLLGVTPPGNVKPRSQFASSRDAKGEARLRINFMDYGTPGEHPQRFGRAGGGIPDGLCGTTNVYEQRWQFHVSHVRSGSTTCIRWHIRSLDSTLEFAATETAEEAIARDRSGRTICNNVLKTMFNMRSMELEDELAKLDPNDEKVPVLLTSIEALRPKRCTVGLLFFGLLHECVQSHYMEQLTKRPHSMT